MTNKGLMVNGTIVALAVATGVFASRKPWQVLGEQRARTERQVEEMRKSEKRHEELVRDEVRARSTVGREEMARRQGWLAPGERLANKP